MNYTATDALKMEARQGPDTMKHLFHPQQPEIHTSI